VVQADRPFSQLQGLCYFEVILTDVGKSQCVHPTTTTVLAGGNATEQRVRQGPSHRVGDTSAPAGLPPGEQQQVRALPDAVLALAVVVINNWALSYRSYGLHCSDYSTQFKGGKKLVYVPARARPVGGVVLMGDGWRDACRWPGTVPALKSGDVVGCGFHNTTHDIFFTHNGKALRTCN
jgi:hypothetical protein